MTKKKRTGKQKNAKKKTILIFLSITLFTLGIFKVIDLYQDIFMPNFYAEENYGNFYVPTGANFETLMDTLVVHNYLNNEKSFRWVAKKKDFTNVKAGFYKIKSGISNNTLINILRSGRQTPVKVSFNSVRFKTDFVKIIGHQLEFEPVDLLEVINDRAYIRSLGFNEQTISAIFIPNTYELYWNTSAKQFVERMHTEFDRFWDYKRENKLEETGLTKTEVITLASIVDEETFRDDEMPEVAGLYINRLKKGMRLQADPTIKFAWNNFEMNRVLSKHLKIDSPYNTYKNSGLPPGPISFPSVKAIDAVLNFEDHDYIYMCAKADFSGYHEFSKTLQQHLNYARQYQRALNRKRIYR